MYTLPLCAASGWSTQTTSTGEVYYANHVDRSTSWERPTAAGAGAGADAAGRVGSTGDATPAVDGEQPLPPGMRRCFSSPFGKGGAEVPSSTVEAGGAAAAAAEGSPEKEKGDDVMRFFDNVAVALGQSSPDDEDEDMKGSASA